MTKKIIGAVTLVILALCLVSGGCSPQDTASLQSLKDLLKIAPKVPAADTGKSAAQTSESTKQPDPAQSIEVKLYFADADGKKLVEENRTIEKSEGIARKTLQELVKGPAGSDKVAIFPEGTRFLDINIKPENGLCVVDLSSEVKNISNAQKEKLMIYAIANTLGQFPTVQGVSFKIDGSAVDKIKYMALSKPVKADLNV